MTNIETILVDIKIGRIKVCPYEEINGNIHYCNYSYCRYKGQNIPHVKEGRLSGRLAECRRKLYER